MKLLCLIFTVYISYLVTLPCADKGMSCRHFHEEPAAAESHDIPGAEDTCSPFCICSCCNVHVIISNFIFYNVPPVTYQALDIAFSTGTEKFYSPFVWQPPKQS